LKIFIETNQTTFYILIFVVIYYLRSIVKVNHVNVIISFYGSPIFGATNDL